MKRTARLLLLAVITPVGVAAFNPPPTSGPSPDPGLITPFPTVWECYYCYRCGSGHEVHDTSPMDDANGPEHGCQPGNCTEHGICGGGGDWGEVALQLEEIREAILNQNDLRLRDVVRNATFRVVVSTARGAIHVMDCGDQVMAHFPISASALEALNQ